MIMDFRKLVFHSDVEIKGEDSDDEEDNPSRDPPGIYGGCAIPPTLQKPTLWDDEDDKENIQEFSALTLRSSNKSHRNDSFTTTISSTPYGTNESDVKQPPSAAIYMDDSLLDFLNKMFPEEVPTTPPSRFSRRSISTLSNNGKPSKPPRDRSAKPVFLVCSLTGNALMFFPSHHAASLHFGISDKKVAKMVADDIVEEGLYFRDAFFVVDEPESYPTFSDQGALLKWLHEQNLPQSVRPWSIYDW